MTPATLTTLARLAGALGLHELEANLTARLADRLGGIAVRRADGTTRIVGAKPVKRTGGKSNRW